VPTLATAVANVRGAGSFGKHAAPWTDTASVGAVFAAIVTDGDGGPTHQKGQSLTICATGLESAAKSITTGTSPAMTSTMDNAGMRGAVCHCPDAPHPGYELAARVAAKRAASPPFANYDGVAIAGTADVPVLLPSTLAQIAYSESLQNTAILDGLTPLAVQNGSLCIVFGRTTMATTAAELWDWSWIDQADNHRLDWRAQAAPVFKGTALIADGAKPSSRNDVNTTGINSFSKAMLRRWQAQGNYDGADALADQCQSRINPSQRSRADAVYPESPKIPLHTIGVVSQRQSPPST
jgi:hypothetical protein